MIDDQNNGFEEERQKATKRNRKPRTTKKAEPVTIDQDVFEQETKNLPVLRDAKGTQMELTVSNIHSLGSDAGQNIGKLSEEILSKVKVADTGELGEGISNILTLTRKVDITRLGQQRTGMLSRVWNIFGDTKQKVLDQFETSKDQIEKITNTLGSGIDRMRGEATWLENAYDANIEYLHELEDILDNVDLVKDIEDKKLAVLMANPDTAMNVLDEQRIITDALDKQADKLRRLVQLAKLTAPQIASMRKVNVNTVEKFESLNTVVIPAWKNNMSLSLISLQQKKDNELSNMIDNETNRLLKDNAKTVAQNMKDAAAANQRGVIDLGTLQSIQNDMLAGIKETIRIEETGRQERKQAAIQMQKMDNDLKTALRDIAQKK
ncbi:Tellurite resistance protein [Yersinia phage fHe-Yen9-04]|uniref:Tellurite resistance protein n=1 Tax=Yersinia phage fHe-Yen9-04 TaxID=2052742 RepID=A0A2C9CXP8_9CAUD|nr:tellurite resistance [Yersinia phage fHe-Yen9-04]SOK58613.1 Tellurite resistance protein [Yersinia phage fHe-Yen9-04]VUE36382.1 Tellurite resistance protein [Yersinia phage fHe-Yen9-04]